jgi:hypothetical protein
LLQGTRLTRRSTIWQKTGESWHILYHQGTMAGSEDNLASGVVGDECSV